MVRKGEVQRRIITFALIFVMVLSLMPLQSVKASEVNQEISEEDPLDTEQTDASEDVDSEETDSARTAEEGSEPLIKYIYGKSISEYAGNTEYSGFFPGWNKYHECGIDV